MCQSRVPVSPLVVLFAGRYPMLVYTSIKPGSGADEYACRRRDIYRNLVTQIRVFRRKSTISTLLYGWLSGIDSTNPHFNSGVSTVTTSISSSVFEFTYANGRRYHSDRFRAEYFMPNDENEQARLDLYHHMFLQLLGGKLYIAPIHKPQRVLDVGTGTGIWAMEFAEWVIALVNSNLFETAC